MVWCSNDLVGKCTTSWHLVGCNVHYWTSKPLNLHICLLFEIFQIIIIVLICLKFFMTVILVFVFSFFLKKKKLNERSKIILNKVLSNGFQCNFPCSWMCFVWSSYLVRSIGLHWHCNYHCNVLFTTSWENVFQFSNLHGFGEFVFFSFFLTCTSFFFNEFVLCPVVDLLWILLSSILANLLQRLCVNYVRCRWLSSLESKISYRKM